MITESRVDQRSTCRYERNLWKHQENLSLSNSLDIVRANTRPRSRNWNNICGDNIRNPLRDISHELKLDIQLTSRRCTRVAVFFIPLDFIMNNRRGVSRRSGWFRKKSQKRRRTGADPVGRKIPVMLRMTLSWWYFNRRAPNNIFQQIPTCNLFHRAQRFSNHPRALSDKSQFTAPPSNGVKISEGRSTRDRASTGLIVSSCTPICGLMSKDGIS